MNRPVLWYLHDMIAVRAEACFSQSTAVRTSLIMQLTSDVARLHRPRHARRWFQPATLPDCGISCSTGVSSGRDFLLSVHIGTASLNRSESSDTASRRCLGQHLTHFGCLTPLWQCFRRQDAQMSVTPCPGKAAGDMGALRSTAWIYSVNSNIYHVH